MRVLAYVLVNGIMLHEEVDKRMAHLTDKELVAEVMKVIFGAPKSTAANPIQVPAFTIRDIPAGRETLIMTDKLAFIQVVEAEVAPPDDELADRRESWREN